PAPAPPTRPPLGLPAPRPHPALPSFPTRRSSDLDALRAHHRALARRYATWPPPGQGDARRYALRHALIHRAEAGDWADAWRLAGDRKSTRLNSSHDQISYAVFCLKKKTANHGGGA